MGWGRGGMKIQRIFRALNLLCMILHVIIYLFKPVEYTIPRMNYDIHYRFQLIMMCVCRFIACNKCTTLVGGLDNGGGYVYLPQGHKELDTLKRLSTQAHTSVFGGLVYGKSVLPIGSVVKSPPALQETQDLSLGWKIFWSRKWQPTPGFLPGKFHGQRGLAGYIHSMGSQESDTKQEQNVGNLSISPSILLCI